MLKIQIKSIYEEVLFEYREENNTIKETLEKAVLEGADLRYANLKGADLKGVDLKGAYLERANLEGVNLEDANLRGADLKCAYLESANLEDANLRGADLEDADLRGVNLRDADLSGAYLEGANLKGANLKGASLEGAYLYVTDANLEEITAGNDAINKFEKETNICIYKTYTNKHILSPYYKTYWENGLIIDKYEYKEPKKKMTLEQIKSELGYDFEFIESEE